jgi:hypothetical protein
VLFRIDCDLSTRALSPAWTRYWYTRAFSVLGLVASGGASPSNSCESRQIRWHVTPVTDICRLKLLSRIPCTERS